MILIFELIQPIFHLFDIKEVTGLLKSRLLRVKGDTSEHAQINHTNCLNDGPMELIFKLIRLEEEYSFSNHWAYRDASE